MKKYLLPSLVATLFVLGGLSTAQAQTCPDGSNPQYSFDVNTGNSTYLCPATAKTAASATTVAGQPTGNGQAPVTVIQSPTPAAPAAPNTTCPSGGQLVNGVCNLGYAPLEPIPGITPVNGTYDLTSPGGFSSFISAIFRILISAGALLAVLMLTIGGVQYMTSSSVGNKTQGLDRAKAALYGLLLIAATWLILNTINPHLLNFNFIACAGGNCQSSINSFTQTSGFTNPNLPPAPSAANTPTHTTSSPSACAAGGGFPMQTYTNGTTECVSMPL